MICEGFFVIVIGSMKILQQHHHLDARVLRAQIRYEGLPQSVQTARQIVSVKLRNCFLLLNRFSRTKGRTENDHGKLLMHISRCIMKERLSITDYTSKDEVFRIEARATKAYWQGVRLLCHAGDDW